MQRSYDPWDEDIESGHSWKKGWLRYREGFPYNECTITQTTTQPYPPEANFTESTHTPAVGQAVLFDASGSKPGFDGDDICPITSYEWNFGDGNVTTEADPIIVHVYLAPGPYTVTLKVTAPGILPDIHPLYVNWDTASDEKDVSQPHPPVAKFSESTHTPAVGQAVYFDASASEPGFDEDNVCPITSYTWDFGDGNITTVGVPLIVHIYQNPGHYTVILNVTAPGVPPYISPLYVDWDTASDEKDVPPPLGLGKVTGGGQIELPIRHSKTGFGSFGFNIVQYPEDPAPKGEIQFVDHEMMMLVHGHTMTSLFVWPDKRNATWTGECTINGISGYTFTVYVEDNGEPGKDDVFIITLSTGYSAGGTLLNGNIQIHKKP